MEVHRRRQPDRAEGVRIDEANWILRLVEGNVKLARSHREEAVLRGVLQRLIRVEVRFPSGESCPTCQPACGVRMRVLRPSVLTKR